MDALRRIGTALAVMWLALTLAFVVLRGVPGDTVDATLARNGATAAERAAEREALGLNDPLWQQYARYVRGLVRGDWGCSLINGQPVGDILTQNLGATLTLTLAALLIAVPGGVLLGVMAAIAPWPVLRLLAEGAISLALATPIYWTATLAIYLLTIEWPVLPGLGATGPRAVVLPALVLGFHTAGSIAPVAASHVRAAQRQDFVRTAHAKGLPPADVLDHVLRVGLLPVIAVIGLQLGFLLSGTVITEAIFLRRGLGRVLLDAITNRDYPVVQGVVLLAALGYSMANALADLLTRQLDPRLT